MKVFLSLLICCVTVLQSFAQAPTQTIRGEISDVETLLPVQQALIEVHTINNDSLLVSVYSDEEGLYAIEKVPVGRVRITVRAAFYESIILEDILVSSGKEVIIDVELNASSIDLESVNVSANLMRGESLNKMSTTSALTISSEQTKKFAGSWDDPMRVVTAYAGIVQQGSGFNHFTIRGNSPTGMTYRLEGVPVHNPNHFGGVGSAGGFVTQFSSELLSNSDFFSSAFPAEFGNATSAAFDFRFRNGNNEKREHTFKASFFGLNLATEGPFSKNSKASYLVNYRYSTLGLLAQIIDLGGVRPTYQDLSFNVNVPLKNSGTLKLFGVGGLSSFNLGANQDSTKWNSLSSRVDRTFGSNSGALGLVYYQPVMDKGYFHAVLAGSTGQYFDNSQYLEDNLSWRTREISQLNDSRITLTADYNHRFSNSHSNKTGVILTHINHDYVGARFSSELNGLDTLGSTLGATQYIQAFSQSKFSFGEKLTVIAGVHYLHFLLNNKYNIEPRIGLTYKPSSNSKIGLSYGHHSRVENLTFYFLKGENSEYYNQGLGLFKAHHIVGNYTKMLTKSLKLSAEAYYQYLYDVPAEVNGAYSVQNVFNALPTGNLENVGKGKNYGLELTLHQFTAKGFYYMFSGSVFESKYQGGDGIWRNGEFNQNFSYNVLAGKEFKLKPRKSKSRMFSLNLNFRHSGGTWSSPIDLEASKSYGWTRYNLDDPYSQRQPNIYNLDFTFKYRVNRRKFSSEFSIDIKNLMSNRAVLSQFYDPFTQSIKDTKDYGVIPIIAYKISF